MEDILAEDQVKKVSPRRADNVGFESRGKDFTFYSSGRISEGFEQSSHMTT